MECGDWKSSKGGKDFSGREPFDCEERGRVVEAYCRNLTIKMERGTITWEQAPSGLDPNPTNRIWFGPDTMMSPAFGLAKTRGLPRVAGNHRDPTEVVTRTRVDLGVEHGITSFAFARMGCAVKALEPDASTIVGTGAIGRLKYETDISISIVRGAGERLPIKDACLDMVNAREALHHVGDLAWLCAEVARIQRPGGAFFAVSEHVISSGRT